MGGGGRFGKSLVYTRVTQVKYEYGFGLGLG